MPTIQRAHVDTVGDDVFLQMARDDIALSGGQLEPQPVLEGEHHHVREHPSLAVGEKSVNTVPGLERFGVTGHQSTEKALAVFAAELQACGGRSVEESGSHCTLILAEPHTAHRRI